MVHVLGLPHRDHAAAVKIDARRLDLCRRFGDLFGRAGELEVNVFQADVFQGHAVGHGQGLIERELPERKGSQPQLVLVLGTRLFGRRLRIGIVGQAIAGGHCGRGARGGPLQKVSSCRHVVLLMVRARSS